MKSLSLLSRLNPILWNNETNSIKLETISLNSRPINQTRDHFHNIETNHFISTYEEDSYHSATSWITEPHFMEQRDQFNQTRDQFILSLPMKRILTIQQLPG